LPKVKLEIKTWEEDKKSRKVVQLGIEGTCEER
jgi:hypothetical protein